MNTGEALGDHEHSDDVGQACQHEARSQGGEGLCAVRLHLDPS